MKRVLLGIICLLPISLMAQTLEDNVVVDKSPEGSLPVEEVQAIDLKDADQNSTENSGQLNKTAADVYSFVTLGTTYYDLQTNASVGRRIVLHDDGTISAVWTFSPNPNAGWPDRGTGYNYYDGSAWMGAPTARTESSRTGWPSISTLSDGSEFTFAHISTDGGFVMNTNAGLGSTSWTQTKELQQSGRVPIWGRMASNGDTIHVICNYYSNTDDGIDEVVIDGIRNPTTYSRSTDGGATWVDEHILLPGYDTTRYRRGGGDTYAIDVQGNTVAIVIGGIGNDVALWKSTDGGVNWTKTICDSFRYAPYDLDTAISQTEAGLSNDGALDVLIDDNGEVHVVYGLINVYDETGTDDQSFNVPQTYNIAYWSETNSTAQVIGEPIDMDGQIDGETGTPWSFPLETRASLGTTGEPQGGAAFAARYGLTSLATHPSISVDGNGNIYVTYDCPVEGIFHDFGANYRDVHIVFSVNGGADWSKVQNLTQLRRQEAVFGSTTRRADDYLHFIFQADETPGTHLQNNGSTGLHPNTISTMLYGAVPVAKILDGSIGAHTLSAEGVNGGEVFVVSQNQPNPFTGSSDVVIYNETPSNLTLVITDMYGKVVKSEDLGFRRAGNHKITLSADGLSGGMYFYTLSSGDFSVTRKMQVQ